MHNLLHLLICRFSVQMLLDGINLLKTTCFHTLLHILTYTDPFLLGTTLFEPKNTEAALTVRLLAKASGKNHIFTSWQVCGSFLRLRQPFLHQESHMKTFQPFRLAQKSSHLDGKNICGLKYFHKYYLVQSLRFAQCQCCVHQTGRLYQDETAESKRYVQLLARCDTYIHVIFIISWQP